MNVVQAQGFQVALASFIGDCLRMSACPLGHGGSVAAATARLQALLNEVARQALTNRAARQPRVRPRLLYGNTAAPCLRAYRPYLGVGPAGGAGLGGVARQSRYRGGGRARRRSW